MAMDDILLAAAKAAMDKAYAPYSKFQVGAALRTPDGQIFSGCNVENAAYPQGCCAEASAISAMVMAGGRKIAEIAVLGKGDALVTPCGGCRQRIREFADLDVPVICHGVEGEPLVTTLAELLPHSFGPEHLGAAK